MRDIWFLFCMAGLASMFAAILMGVIADFFSWRAAVNRQAWWRHVTGLDQK